MSAIETPAPVEVTPENLEAVLAANGCKGPDFGLISKFEISTGELAGNLDALLDNDESYNPLSMGVTQFPFDKLFSHMDGEPEPLPCGDAHTAEVLSLLLRWIVSIEAKDSRYINWIATRAIVAAWVVRPDWFNSKPLHKVASEFKLPKTKFSEHAASFSRHFNFRNAYQRHSRHNVPSIPPAQNNESQTKGEAP